MSGKRRKKTGEKFLNEIDPVNGPYTQCKNGHQMEFKFFFYIKKSLANHVLKKKIQKNVLFKERLLRVI